MSVYAPVVVNPKLQTATEQWFHYYAGFSDEFVTSVLDVFGLEPEASVLDSWLGGGTTACAAVSRQLAFAGVELNPVMVLIALARIYSRLPTFSSTLAAAQDNLAQIVHEMPIIDASSHDLATWIGPSMASFVLSMIQATSRLPVTERPISHHEWAVRIPQLRTDQVLLLAAALTAIRARTRSLRGSNPTWPKRPELATEIACSPEALQQLIENALMALPRPLTKGEPSGSTPNFEVTLASSTLLPYAKASFDAVVTSPPYCTRIDYCKKTQIELTALGLTESTFRGLRDCMIGTPTITNQETSIAKLPKDVRGLLREIERHDSYAAREYYAKFYRQYFSSLDRSMAEMARVLKQNGRAAIVVQTSHFKEVEIDLPQLLISVSRQYGLTSLETLSWKCTTNLAHINPAAKKYIKRREDFESVVVLQKEE